MASAATGYAGLSLSREVEKGLPMSALDQLVRSLAPNDASFAFRLVPRATLARRRSGGARAARLSPAEGARVARLATVWEMARDIWKDDKHAREFLFRPHMLLDGQRPVDLVLANEFGGRLVEELLGRLQYGTAI
ncbi:MAG: antitoxin Xre/MbcA/ParS toxin-binding domain-containing protein [Acetobacteraceae bacterium]